MYLSNFSYRAIAGPEKKLQSFILAKFKFLSKSLRIENLVEIFFKLQTTSIPIGALTRAKSSCSDGLLPIGYLLRDFQPNRRNFIIHSLPPAPRPERNGVDTMGDGVYYISFEFSYYLGCSIGIYD